MLLIRSSELLRETTTPNRCPPISSSLICRWPYGASPPLHSGLVPANMPARKSRGMDHTLFSYRFLPTV